MKAARTCSDGRPGAACPAAMHTEKSTHGRLRCPCPQKGLNPELGAYIGWLEDYASHSRPGPDTAELLHATKVAAARMLLHIAKVFLAEPQLRSALDDVSREWPLVKMCASSRSVAAPMTLRTFPVRLLPDHRQHGTMMELSPCLICPKHRLGDAIHHGPVLRLCHDLGRCLDV